jgi:hypothetical protein
MARLCGRGGMHGSGYLFRPRVNGDSTVVPERHQVGRRRDLEPVRFYLVWSKNSSEVDFAHPRGLFGKYSTGIHRVSRSSIGPSRRISVRCHGPAGIGLIGMSHFIANADYAAS